MKPLKQHISESFSINEAKVPKVTDKDWKRMFDLSVMGKDGASVASKIKDANKAMIRFVAGLKLERQEPEYNRIWNEYQNQFNDFGDRAIELGKSVQEIEEFYNSVELPEKWIQKLHDYSGKKLNDRFVQRISKAVLDAGFNIQYMPHNGYAMTHEGKYAMQESGIKWTIGYKTEITVGETKYIFEFDAITDEGDGPTKFVLCPMTSKEIQKYISPGGVLNITTFLKGLNSFLKSVS
jgi:hypothetical protein